MTVVLKSKLQQTRQRSIVLKGIVPVFSLAIVPQRYKHTVYIAKDIVADVLSPIIGETLETYEHHGQLSIIISRNEIIEVLRELRDHPYPFRSVARCDRY